LYSLAISETMNYFTLERIIYTTIENIIITANLYV